jgi:S-formylglutathione hydrolase
MNIRLSTARWLAIALCSLPGVAPNAQTPSPDQPLGQPPTSAGHYERITVHGPSLVGNLEGDSPDRMVSVYLPPGYAKSGSRRYPVLYLLHGFTDSDSYWFGLRGKHFVSAQTAIDGAFAAGAHEMIVVMPDAYTKFRGSMYSNSVVTGNWEAFITQDLVSYIDKHYRTLATRASRGLAGHSMGGYGTIRIGMKYPEVFSSLYAMSPCCLGATLEPDAATMARAAQPHIEEQTSREYFGPQAMLASAAAWSPDPDNPPRYLDLPVVDGKPVPEVIERWIANAPLAMATQYIPNLKSYTAIAFDAGDKDMQIAGTVRTLDDILRRFGVAHVSEIYDGDHLNHIEERLRTKVMPFFSEHLQTK